MTIVERLQRAGIRRTGAPKRGFRYLTAAGSRPSPADLARIRALVVPPAWEDVWISGSPASAVQAVGRDRAGRWQYLYSEKQTRTREERKRERLLALLRVLPALRAHVARDLRGEGLTRERVLAAMARLTLRGFLRPGSEVYTRENGTYGLTTLRARHVRVTGRRIELSYRGKGRKQQRRLIDDAPAARVVRALLAEPGPTVFCYRDTDGALVRVRRRHLNEYLREIAGARFTARDFRTWAGTLLGACALARQGYPEPASPRAVRRSVAAAMRETSRLLGNTPTVCRTSYVSPAVLSSFERGRVLPEAPTLEALVRASPRALAVVERRLASLLLGNPGSPARAEARDAAGRRLAA